MRKLWLVLGAAAGLSIAVVAIGDPQTGCTVWVEPGASLQAAIAAAPPGAVICLPQGSWEENLIITKSVTIRGQGAERTRISWSGGTDPFFISQPVIWIKGEGEPITVIIEDLAIQGPPGSGSWWGLPHGLVAQGTAWVEVRGVRVSGNPGIGIWLSESAQGAIRDTAVLENEHGVLLSDEAQATLEGVRAAHNRMHNIALGGASRARITNSIVEEAGFYGVTVGEQAQLTLSECQLIGGANGLVVAGEAEAVVNNCLIKNAEFDGVLLMGSPQLRLFRSTITGNGVGIGLKYYSHLEVVGCTISENGLGIGLRHASQAEIIDNVIVGNSTYGVAFGELGCFPDHPCTRIYAALGEGEFQGSVAGAGNTIQGNLLAPVCPAILEFLATEEGGAIDLSG